MAVCEISDNMSRDLALLRQAFGTPIRIEFQPNHTSPFK
jgi:hypothetical protein